MDVTPAENASAKPSGTGSLHLVCGKIAAGKSTLAKQLASRPQTVILSEDVWLARLYPDELRSISDYIRLSGRLRAAMESHIVALLQSGTSVVLDFPSNTLNARAWGRSIFEKAGASHCLHFLDVPDEECKQRLRLRNLSGDHPFQTTDEQFEQITKHFVEPSLREGFNLVLHRCSLNAPAHAESHLGSLVALGRRQVFGERSAIVIAGQAVGPIPEPDVEDQLLDVVAERNFFALAEG